jgi:extracellular factor (EF) 3-hydroxypalmitic acid methyl ester biosynthesis protein
VDYIRKIVEKKGPEKSDYQALQAKIEHIGILLENSLSNNIYREFIEVIKPVLTIETMQGFAFHKPHGYSGDYEIIDKIYSSSISEDPNFKKWDEFFHAQEAARAVRNRKEFFLNLLVDSLKYKKEISVLNVGSGPGRDVYEFFQRYPESQVYFDCVDYDKDANIYASNLCTLYLKNINYFQKNIFRLSLNKKYDIIWSAGVFDYLDDKQFVSLLNKLRLNLVHGGSLIIGNFSTANPTKKYMELFGKWFLYHRSEQELIELAIQSGVEERYISVVSEPLGVNLFLRINNGLIS